MFRLESKNQWAFDGPLIQFGRDKLETLYLQNYALKSTSLIPQLPSYGVSASSERVGFEAFKVFDGDYESAWSSENFDPLNPVSLTVTMPSSRITAFQIYGSTNATSVGRTPIEVTISGSNDGSRYRVIAANVALTYTDAGSYRYTPIIPLTIVGSFKYFKLEINDIPDGAGSRTHLGELKLFGSQDVLYDILPEFSYVAVNPYDAAIGMDYNKDLSAPLQGFRVSVDELDALIDAHLNPDLSYTNVLLYTNDTFVFDITSEIDISADMLPTGGRHVHATSDIGDEHLWLKTVESGGAETLTYIGVVQTVDETGPAISSATMALGTNLCREIDLTFSASDNVEVASIYVYLSTSATTPTVATMKASGILKLSTDTTHTFSSLVPATTYYAYIYAEDSSGNGSAVSAFTPASLTTAQDSSAPTVDSFSIATAAADEEGSLTLSITISDTVA